ncbi:MAG TPA: hypothetical protein VH374_07160 [Polyangia bacterium]|nr:hypothetical protein [Polyangia bacterium]
MPFCDARLPVGGTSWPAWLCGLALIAAPSIGCGGSSPARAGTGGQGGGAAGVDDAGSDEGGDAPAVGDGANTDGAASTLGGCIDKVGGTNTSPMIVNHPDGICDTYGSFTLTVHQSAATTAVNVTLFRVDNTGLNLGASDNHYKSGVWSTSAGAQNIPGNYVAHLFIATTPTPGPDDFQALTDPLTLNLSEGDHTLYFFADGDDMNGGTYGFGINVWVIGDVPSGPSLSGFEAVPGGALAADATMGCSPAYDGTCGNSAHTLVVGVVGLTSFTVAGVGGAAAPVDGGTSD